MRLDGVIFDLDGTLGDTLPACFAAFRRALGDFTDRRFTDREIMALFGPSEEGMIQRLVPSQWQACLQTYLAEYARAHLHYAKPFPGIETALGLLKERGVAVAIVTGKGAQSAAISLNQLGLADYFEIVETGSPNGGVKPSSIQKVLTTWGALPHRVAYVGDAASDIEAARAVGVIPLGAAWDARSDAHSLSAMGPLATFCTVEGFIRWIETDVESNRG